jgi:K+-sensing histidine kinase KdpD
MIATQALRLTQITEEVLLTARLDRGAVHLEQELIDLADLARATIAVLGSQLPPDRPVSLEVEPGLPPARGDRDRVQQALVNVLDNAVKYGRPPVEVSLEARTSVVCIAVTDSGPGIPDVEQERIFDKFYRSRRFGTFSRTIGLPQGVEDADVKATVEHGVLYVHVAKPEQPKPRKIQVGSGGSAEQRQSRERRLGSSRSAGAASVKEAAPCCPHPALTPMLHGSQGTPR